MLAYFFVECIIACVIMPTREQFQPAPAEDNDQINHAKQLREASSEDESAEILCPIFKTLGGIAYLGELVALDPANTIYKKVRTLLENESGE